MKKWILALFVILAVLAVGIWSQYPNTDNTAVQIRVIGEDWSPMQGLERLLPEYKEATGVDVAISRFDAQTVRKKSIADFQAGTANYDVIMGWGMDVGLFGANGYVLNLDDSLNKPGWRDPALDLENFPTAFVDEYCRFEDKLFALPCTAQGMLLWYRKDLLENEAERAAFEERFGYAMPSPTPSWSMTWGQYRDVADFFTRKKGQFAAGKALEDDLFGTVIQGKNFIALWYEFSNYLYGFGGSVVSADGKEVTVNSPEALAALKFYIGLKEFAPPGSVNYTWDEALSSFQNGQVALSIMWTDSINFVEDPEQSKTAGKIGYAANPTRTPDDPPMSVSAGWGFYVNSKSAHPKEAVQFIQWCNRPDVQARWALDGLIPTTRSTYATTEYSSLPGAAAQLESLEHAFNWSKEPYSGRLVGIGQATLARAVAGEISPEEALRALDSRYRAILDSTGE